MVSGSITEEVAVSVPAERLWKVAFAETKAALLPKACAGFIDAVEVHGDGGPGTVTTMKLNPSAVGGETATTFKSRVVALDSAARVLRTEVLQGGAVSAQLKTHVTEVKLEDAAGDGACVAKVKVEYERHDGGGPLAPEDEAKLAQGYVRLVRMVEAYLVAHPDEFA